MAQELAGLFDPSAAMAFGVLGLASQMAAPLFRERETILLAQLAAATSYASSYALMGQETGAAVCLVGASQTTLALIAGDRPWLRRTGYVFLPLVLVIGLLTYSGAPTVLAVTACCLIMLGRFQRDLLRMRAVQLAAAPFGLTHDILVGAMPALVGATMSFAIAAAAFERERRARRRVAP